MKLIPVTEEAKQYMLKVDSLIKKCSYCEMYKLINAFREYTYVWGKKRYQSRCKECEKKLRKK